MKAFIAFLKTIPGFLASIATIFSAATGLYLSLKKPDDPDVTTAEPESQTTTVTRIDDIEVGDSLISWRARLDEKDHFDGDRKLKDPQSVIIRDRVNFHSSKVAKDPEDTNDKYFGNYKKRDLLRPMLKKTIQRNPGLHDAIMSFQPLVEVTVKANRAEVTILDKGPPISH
jgi:hypothetical protein